MTTGDAAALPAPPAQPILLTVLGGYLGAGKTTLLNHLLRHADGRRLGVIVNDFGSINIDAALIESRAGETLTLANGCVCCSVSGGFAEALRELSRRSPPPEQVIIEASGVADPVKVGYFASLPPYRLDGVVVVVDAETIRARTADKYVGGAVLRQLQGADLIVLNKIDLIADTERPGLRAWLRSRVPAGRIVETGHGRAPAAMLLGPHGAATPRPRDGGHSGAHEHDHAAQYASASVTFETPLHEAQFRDIVGGWPPTVLRAKGVIRLVEDPTRRHVFQLVGRRWSLEADRAWGPDLPVTQIVTIGLAGQFDGDALLAALTRGASIP
jgi:G3E family GTPase